MDRLLPFEWIAAVRFLKEGRTQSFLIVAGVSIGVAVIVFMSALLSGLQGNIVRRTLSTQPHISIQPAEEIARPLRGPEFGAVASLIQRQSQRLRSIDQWQSVNRWVARLSGVTGVAPVASGPAFVVRGDANKAITLFGVEAGTYTKVIGLDDKLVAGQFRLATGDVLIGVDLARDLGAAVGDKVRLSTAAGRSETVSVIGVFDLGNRIVNQRYAYVGLRSGQTLLDLAGGASSLEVTVEPVFDAERIALTVSSATGLKADSWIKSNAELFIALNAQRITNTTIRVFVGLAVAFGIASVLAVSVVQRAKEIGILRAMGSTRGQILRIFLIQGGLLGVAGSLVGSTLGAVILALWRLLARNPDGTPLFIIPFDPMLFVWAGLVAALVGVLAAVAPARRAAALDPVVAIRG